MLYDGFTIILPTLNEAENVGALISRLLDSYKGIYILVSDDGSIDNTKDIVLSFHSQRIFFLDRSRESIHGLTASILEAVRIVKTRHFIVMDADNQHPWEKVKEIIDNLNQGEKLVIASRKRVEGRWPISRKSVSYLGNILGKVSLLARGKIYINYDLLTGFFGAEAGFWRRIAFENNNFVRFRLKGYKIVFDFLKVMPDKIPVKNVYYIFNARKKGFSKLNSKIYIEFLKALFL